MTTFATIKNGDRLFDCHRTKMGNTTMSRMGCWTVDVIEVDRLGRRARVRWNGNASEWWSEARLSKLRRTKHPEAR